MVSNTICIMGRGNQQADFVLVGEAPGEEEDRIGKPFVGASGRLLSGLLKKAGIPENKVYITNTVKCHPPGNMNPRITMIRSCRAFLVHELLLLQPKVVVLLGGIALKGYFDRSDNVSVAKHRLRDVSHPKHPFKVFVTYHPSACLYDQTRKPYLLNDLRKAYAEIDPSAIEDPMADVKYFPGDDFPEDIPPTVGVDLETTGLNPFTSNAKITDVGIATAPKKAYWFNDPDECADILVAEHVKKVAHNAMFDMTYGAALGYRFRGKIWCTMAAEHLIDENSPSLALEDVAIKYLGAEPWKPEIPVPEMDTEDRQQYVCQDTDFTRRIASQQIAILRKRGQMPLAGMTMATLRRLSEATCAGAKIDHDRRLELLEEFEADMAEAHALVCKKAGTINLNSGKQLGEFVYKKLGLTPTKFTASKQPSTAAEDLEAACVGLFHGKRKYIEAILRYKKLNKLKTTYIEGLPKHCDSEGFVHSSFNLARAVTRLSSSNPNLQNIPKRADKRIRELFVSRFRNGVILSGDLNQAELRMLAHVSGDVTLKAAFSSRFDIHRYTASKIFHKDPESVTEHERYMGKTVNFGVIYGMSAFKFAHETQLPVSECQKIIDSWFATYDDVQPWKEIVYDTVEAEGYVTNPFGRRRHLIVGNRWSRNGQRALRQAVNSIIQSAVFDYLNAVLVNIDLIEKGFRSRLIAQVHDEVVLDVHPREVDDVAEIVANALQCPCFRPWYPDLDDNGFDVEMTTELSAGHNWGQQEQIYP